MTLAVICWPEEWRSASPTACAPARHKVPVRCLHCQRTLNNLPRQLGGRPSFKDSRMITT
jgi:hypothetical protein